MNDTTDQQRRRLDAHIFVCTHSRESQASCAGGEKTLEAVKTWLEDRNAFWSPIGVTETGCLGLCSGGGTAITIQPHDVWYSDVKPSEVPNLLESVFESEPWLSDR